MATAVVEQLRFAVGTLLKLEETVRVQLVLVLMVAVLLGMVLVTLQLFVVWLLLQWNRVCVLHVPYWSRVVSFLLR